MAVGMIYKRCTCRVPVLDERGRPVRGPEGRVRLRRLGARCPRLRLANGRWNPRHGAWNAQVEAPRAAGARRVIVRRGGLPDKDSATRFVTALHALWALAEQAEDPVAARGEITAAICAELAERRCLPDYDTVRRNLRAGQPVRLELTVGEYLTDWLASLKDLRPSTRRQYESAVRVHLIPHLGHMHLRALRRHHIEAMLTAIADQAKRTAADNAARHAADDARKRAWRERDRVGLDAAHARLAALPGYRRPTGPGRRQRIRATLRAALSDARDEGLIGTNPASHVRMDSEPGHTPTLWTAARITQWRRTGRKPSSVMVWTPAQLNAFLSATKNDPLHLLFLLMAYTGLRRGEALGLRWSDLDLSEQCLYVTRELSPGADGFEFTAPKSDAAMRPVALDATIVTAFIAEAEKRSGKRGSAALAALGDALIFATAEGEPLNPDRVYEYFQRLSEQAGLPPVRLHDLRHGAATYARVAHVEPKTLSKLLGHASAAFTLQTYGTVPDELQHAAAHSIAEVINGGGSKRRQSCAPKSRPRTRPLRSRRQH